MDDDELTQSPLWDALLAPGTADELAGEGAALAAFRSASTKRVRRGARRLGVVGGAGLAVFIAAGAGVAAAYTDHLPGPLQDAAHFVLPAAPQHHDARVTPRAASKPSPRLATPSPRSQAPSVPQTHSASPHPTPSRATAPAGHPVAPPAAPAPTASPSPSPSPVVAPELTESLSATSVPVHSSVTATGSITRAGAPLAGVTVYLARQNPGQQGWTRIGHATTDAQGKVQLVASDLGHNVKLRLAGLGTTSGARSVVVRPAVSVKVTTPTAGKRRLAVTTDGAVAGDSAVLERLDGSTWTVVTTHQLDSSAATAFTVNAPASGSTKRFRVRIKATVQHGVGMHWVTLRTA